MLEPSMLIVTWLPDSYFPETLSPSFKIVMIPVFSPFLPPKVKIVTRCEPFDNVIFVLELHKKNLKIILLFRENKNCIKN